MATISASVGEGGANRESDVRLVQQLLLAAGFDPKGIDGDYGTNTRKAIIAFQKTFMSNPDGRIDPGGKSIGRLAQAGGQPGAPASGAAPSAPAAGGAKITDWSGDSSQWSHEKKLASLAPSFRPKVERVFEALKQAGFQPRIVFGWRSVRVQARLKAEGKSPLSFSFHCAQKPDGTPFAWAVDMIDSRWAWQEPNCHKFFKALGVAAKAEGLVWGGDWSSPDWAHIQGRKNNELGAVKRESGLA